MSNFDPKFDWAKHWEGHFSIFQTHNSMRGYYKPMLEIMGATIEPVFITQVKGIVAGYYSKASMEKFVEHLLSQVSLDKNLIEQWAQSLKDEADAMSLILNSQSDTVLDQNIYNQYCETINRFTVYQISNKELGNNLPDDLNEKYFPILEDARRYAEKVYFEVEGYVGKLQRKIAEQSGYDINSLTCLSHEEILNYFTNQELPPQELLAKRFEQCGFYFSSESIQELSDDELTAFFKAQKENSEVKGQVAYPGNVTGKVRVINDFHLVGEYEEGSILVTGMTDPNFEHLMRKSGAIVTDAGGRLCHAAIVSREFKIPCIVGTGNASHVLKDGDLVEVDAVNGIVKIIQHNYV